MVSVVINFSPWVYFNKGILKIVICNNVLHTCSLINTYYSSVKGIDKKDAKLIKKAGSKKIVEILKNYI